MFKFYGILALFSWFVSASICSAQASKSGNITVSVNRLRNNSGIGRIALYDSKCNFDKSVHAADHESNALKKGEAVITDNTAKYTFENVPYGYYAVKFFHDEDKSGKFKKSALGIPRVEHGYSNDPDTTFGMATYDNARFPFHVPNLNLMLNPSSVNAHSKMKIRTEVPE
jgi:uncharacterized protein (DUF2141 family)